MPRRQILTDQGRASLFDLPTDEGSLLHHNTLADDDIECIRERRLLDRMETDDVLVVTQLDRLGRDAIDVSNTVARLEEMGIRVHCLASVGGDLTNSAGKLTLGVINAVAQFERDLLIERTQAGLDRAKASGKVLGRPRALSSDQQDLVRDRLAT